MNGVWKFKQRTEEDDVYQRVAWAIVLGCVKKRRVDNFQRPKWSEYLCISICTIMPTQKDEQRTRSKKKIGGKGGPSEHQPNQPPTQRRLVLLDGLVFFCWLHFDNNGGLIGGAQIRRKVQKKRKSQWRTRHCARSPTKLAFTMLMMCSTTVQAEE